MNDLDLLTKFYAEQALCWLSAVQDLSKQDLKEIEKHKNWFLGALDEVRYNLDRIINPEGDIS